MTIPTRQQVINKILITKRMLRQLKIVIDSIGTNIGLYERKAKLLSESKFNRHLVNELNILIKQATEACARLSSRRKEKALILSRWMTQYDLYRSNNHEKSQLLGISHIAFNRFLEGEYSGDGSLYQSAMLHCETFGENDDWIGQSGNRDSPLFDATNYEMRKALTENKEFRDQTSKFMDEMIGVTPRYQKITYSDGSETFERMPPQLKLVETDSD